MGASSLASILTESAARAPQRTAIRLDDVELTYAQLDGASAHVAGLLAEHGFQPGDRVGLMLPNVPHFPVLYYGILRAGGIVVPMNVLLKQREVAYYLGDSGAKLLFAWHELGAEADPGCEEAGARLISVAPGAFEEAVGAAAARTELHDVGDDDTAVILYTSGTTGKPKGAELTHANLRVNAGVKGELIGLGADDVILGALPLFHSFGQTAAMNAGVLAGATLSLLARFEPLKALQVMERDRVTLFLGVPTMYFAMLGVPADERPDTSSLRVCVSGGASLPVEVMRAFEEQFGCPILEGYGLSETSPVACFNRLDRERKPGSIGIPITDVEMRVVDEQGAQLPVGEVGEIVIRGPNVMKGYWGRPDATAEAIRDGGWFHSGDLARMDADGDFFIVDRMKDMIIRGGYNVYPREVEEVLYEHPAVAEAAVVGIPDPGLGEEVGAAVALKAGAQATPDELQAYVKERVAAYKYPRQVWLVPELPKGPTGKILKREIAPPATTPGAPAAAAD
jgi:long-chain acyl-CoA synthetase